MRRSILRLLLAMSSSGLVQADTSNSPFFATGNQFLKHCSYDSTECAAFIAGLDSGLRGGAYTTLRSISLKEENVAIVAHVYLGYCISGVTLGQMYDVAIKYLKENPATRHQPASSLILNSWKQAWPCPVTKSDKPPKTLPST